MTLPGFPALALLMASTTQGLNCKGAPLLIVLTITPLKSLLGKIFFVGTRAAGGGVVTASAKESDHCAVS
jgi:hypothetical protein